MGNQNEYIALLRGINISGKNQIAMADLKKGLESIGFSNVSTYLNSGNVRFFSHQTEHKCREQIESMLQATFCLSVPVYITTLSACRDALANAPSWWGTGVLYDNLIFILSDDSVEQICHALGAPSEGLERICVYQNVIFWSFDRKSYQKCSWWKKTAAKPLADKLTIRTANTLKKLCK